MILLSALAATVAREGDVGRALLGKSAAAEFEQLAEDRSDLARPLKRARPGEGLVTGR